MELYAGELLFCTHENLEHLALMEQIIGKIPQEMMERANDEAKRSYLRRKSDGRWELNWPQHASSKSQQRVRDAKQLHRQVMKHHAPLAEFCGLMLTMNPRDRVSAKEAMKDHFLSMHIEE